MRIAFLGSKGIPGRHGVEVVVEEVASRLADLGHEVTVYGFQWYMNNQRNYRGCILKPVKVPKSRLLEMPMGIIGSVKSICGNPENFDIVHIHSADPCMFARPLSGIIPMVATSHGRAYRRQSVGLLRSLMSHLAEQRFLTIPDICTCVSPADTEYYNLRSKKNVEYIPNGMPILGKGREKDLSKWNIKKNRYILFSAGRILPSKGLHTLIQAYSKLNLDLPLVVVGGPSTDRNYFERQKTEAPEGVIFTGFITDESLWSLYRFPRLAVFPSEAEAQSMTLLEFLAMGVDVVFSDIPENMIVAEGLGFPFCSGSANSLMETINDVISGKSVSKTDDAARKRLIETHNWDAIVLKYICQYEKAIAAHGGS